MALDLEKLKQAVIAEANHRMQTIAPQPMLISTREHDAPQIHALIAAILAVVDEHFQPRPETGSRFVVRYDEE